MVIRTKKKQFKQSEFDRLAMKKARAMIALRKARQELEEYEKTHTRGY